MATCRLSIGYIQLFNYKKKCTGFLLSNYNMLKGKRVVFSGFNNLDLKTRIEANGGKVTTAVSNITDFLVAKDLHDIKTTKKIGNARTKGTQIISLDNFVDEYLSGNVIARAVAKEYSTKKSKKYKMKTQSSEAQASKSPQEPHFTQAQASKSLQEPHFTQAQASKSLQEPQSTQSVQSIEPNSKIRVKHATNSQVIQQAKIKTKKNKKEVPASLYFLQNEHNAPSSVDALEALVRLKPDPLNITNKMASTQPIQLQHGDIVILYADALVVVDDGNNVKSLLKIKGHHTSIKLKIPLEVTRSIRNAIQYYQRVEKVRYNMRGVSLDGIELDKNDKTWKSVFVRDNPISRDAQVQYLPYSKALRVKYKKWFGDFNIKDVKQDIIDKFFYKLENPEKTIIPTLKIKNPGDGPFNPYRNNYYEVPIDGSEPYAVSISQEYSTFKVAKCWRTPDDYDCDRIVVKPIPYQRIWLNNANYEQWRGNVLVQLTNKQYMYIGNNIYTFDVEDGDDIQTFASPASDGDEPYHYAVATNNIYLFSVGRVMPISMLPKKKVDLSTYVYNEEDANDLSLPRIRNKKMIHKPKIMY
jgi:hypothetical protein